MLNTNSNKYIHFKITNICTNSPIQQMVRGGRMYRATTWTDTARRRLTGYVSTGLSAELSTIFLCSLKFSIWPSSHLQICPWGYFQAPMSLASPPARDNPSALPVGALFQPSPGQYVCTPGPGSPPCHAGAVDGHPDQHPALPIVVGAQGSVPAGGSWCSGWPLLPRQMVCIYLQQCEQTWKNGCYTYISKGRQLAFVTMRPLEFQVQEDFLFEAQVVPCRT